MNTARTRFTLSWILSLVAIVPLAACKGDSYQRVPQPAQDVEVSSPSVCRVYLMRMPQGRGAIRTVRVRDGDLEIGSLGADTFLCWERAPGRTLVALDYEGPVLDQTMPGVLDLDCAAGETAYYGISIDTDWNRPVVRMLDREEAREILRDLKPAPAD